MKLKSKYVLGALTLAIASAEGFGAYAPEADAKAQSKNLYFKNCTAAKKAGYYNIKRGAPGYRKALDRDNDGIACEK
ncbi:excalibur calcium-binding domain-containing protein [Paenibacillus sp. YPG26]|uniref:excalibur calcium-binding domain-containing protein n=1 Tax=Paenibacillus sp. YPG26 TaxID=2878915 RepID=UPI002041ED02|nr:excalibur calcium-binding domain-containing protein [Paenibacillus sp. YPG26]USB32291.1 excalibur calcium-binding domain-containing protein [Paenibacillus sp. YPG26]